MDNLLKLYQAILESLDVVADKDGLLTYRHGDIDMPYTVDGKRLVLPTPQLLKLGLGDNLVAFHPLSESSVRGESPVLRRLKSAINFRLSQVTAELLQSLVEVAVDSGRHSKISPKAAKFLVLVPDVDDKTAHAMEKVLAKTSPDQNRLVSVYLKRGGKLNGQKFARTAMVAFPFFEEFADEQPEIFGTKIRKKDMVAIKALFEYIFPDPDLLETYSAGSNALTAPFFDALMHAYERVATQLNSIVTVHRKELDDHKSLLIDTSWSDLLADLADFRDVIPPLPGNEGDLIDGGGVAGTATVNKPLSSVGAVKEAPKKLFYNTEPEKAAPPAAAPLVKTDTGVSFASVLNRGASQQHGGGWGNGQGWQQPAQQMPPAPVTYYRGMAQQPAWNGNAGWGQQGGGNNEPAWLHQNTNAPVVAAVGNPAPMGAGWNNNSGWGQPAQTGWGQPAATGWNAPAQTGWNAPANNGWGRTTI